MLSIIQQTGVTLISPIDIPLLWKTYILHVLHSESKDLDHLLTPSVRQL